MSSHVLCHLNTVCPQSWGDHICAEEGQVLSCQGCPVYPSMTSFEEPWKSDPLPGSGASHLPGALSHVSCLSLSLGTISVLWFSRWEQVSMLPKAIRLVNLEPKSERHSWPRNSWESTSPIFLYLQIFPVVTGSQHSGQEKILITGE